MGLTHGKAAARATMERAVYTQPGAGLAVVGHLRLLVHRGADPVAHEGPHDAVAADARDALDGVPDVADPVAGDRRGDPGLHGPLRGVDQLAHLARDAPDRPGPGTIRVPPVHDAADVDAHQVAVSQAPARRGDAVDDLVVE